LLFSRVGTLPVPMILGRTYIFSPPFVSHSTDYKLDSLEVIMYVSGALL
jgi:hypothetical protein